MPTPTPLRSPTVLIIGAGPVGLTLAAELVRYGITVRIVDQAPRPTDKSKALVLWSRTLELLDRGIGSHSFIENGLKVTAANIIAGGKTIGRIGLTEVKSPHPYALMLPQSETERLLAAHLETWGIHVGREITAVGFEQTTDAVYTNLQFPDGAEERVTSAWLVGCDGAHSIVRHKLGLGFEGSTLLTDWVLADVHLTGLAFPENELAMFWHQDGALAIFPISAGRYRIIADFGRSLGSRPPEVSLEQIQQIVDRRGPGNVQLSDPIWISGFRINERKVKDYRSGRVFLAGDAAHVHSPAGGQGMNTGMQDAFNLAWKIALASQRNINAEKLLQSYSLERSAVGDAVLAAAGRLTSLAVLKNPIAQNLRNIAARFLLTLPPVRRTVADQLTEVAIGYPRSPLTGTSSAGPVGPKAGQRVPINPATANIGGGPAPRFAFFAAATEQSEALLTEYCDLLEPGLRPPLAPAGAWLVRPDGYVACVCAAGRLQAIADYLRSLR